MREIKFRVFDESKNKMFTKVTIGNTCNPSSDDYTAHAYYDNEWLHFDEHSDDVNVMQYTGLKDKNGKEIYEGDIVSGNWINLDLEEYLTCEVKFSPPYFTPFGARTGDGSGMLYQTVLLESDFEVIGNIHENKELLDNAK